MAAGAAAEGGVFVGAHVEVDDVAALAAMDLARAFFQFGFQTTAAEYAMSQTVLVEQHKRTGFLVSRARRRVHDAEDGALIARMRFPQRVEKTEQPTARRLAHRGNAADSVLAMTAPLSAARKVAHGNNAHFRRVG